MKITLRFRLRDKHRSDLRCQAKAVNAVWNYCNETQQKAVREQRKWLTAVALQRLTSGSSQELGLHAHSIQKVAEQYVRSRLSKRRPWLRFRGKKSLGWVPFNKGHVKFRDGAFVFNGCEYEPMHMREFPQGAIICSGSFSQDARGRWYINCPIEVEEKSHHRGNPVGVDLGLKDVAVLSTGERIGNPSHYRRLEKRLASAQRAKKAKLKKTVSAKIANSRHDYLHKASANISAAHNPIFVGNVSSKKLARTRFAKSVLDAGWSMLRNQLRYKAVRHGGRMIEVDERLTTQVCSACGCLPEGRPKGIAGLRIREWTCCECGTVHDRDVNAARNILRCGLASLVEGAAI